VCVCPVDIAIGISALNALSKVILSEQVSTGYTIIVTYQINRFEFKNKQNLERFAQD